MMHITMPAVSIYPWHVTLAKQMGALHSHVAALQQCALNDCPQLCSMPGLTSSASVYALTVSFPMPLQKSVA